jgi:hypothetical protein
MSRLRVYVSAAISDGGRAGPTERLHNVRKAMRAFLELVEMGLSPLLPQLTEFIEIECGIRLPHATWMDLDMPWVEASDIVLRLPGDSAGADLEVAHARRHGIPVVFSFEELRELLNQDVDEPFPLESLEEK